MSSMPYKCNFLKSPTQDSNADYYRQYRAGHYNRALEEAIQTHKSQWAKDWESKNPLSGGATFSSMIPTERVCFSLTSLCQTKN
jgi:hypothetical protein